MSGRAKDAPTVSPHTWGCEKCKYGGMKAIKVIGGWACPCICHKDIEDE